ncbi:MAG: hypothetical protein ACR2PW_06020 [Gammaproteobacteria bacterium]
MPTKNPITHLRTFFAEKRQMKSWRKRLYLEQAPQFIKQNVLLKYAVPQAQWVETGTYFGTTTQFLAERFDFVYSIEPGKELFDRARRLFSGRNIELLNGTSEEMLPQLLPKLKGNINFWLDGHYSAGVTFQGPQDCPVEDELSNIDKNLNKFNDISIFIDDIHCFWPDEARYSNYPSVGLLVDWAHKRNFFWRIKHDIFIMRRTGQHS